MKRIELNRELLEESNIPPKFWYLGIDTYTGCPNVQRKIIQYIKQSVVAKTNGVGLFLFGLPQTYKTFLGTFVLKCVLSRGFSVRYTTMSDVAGEYFGTGETGHTLRQLYGSVDFVFIDDMEITPNKGHIAAIARVLQIRSVAGLPTIVASHLPKSELAEQFGETVARHFNLMESIGTDTETAAFDVHAIQEQAKSKIWEDV